MTNENIKKGQEILMQDFKKWEEQELTCLSYMDGKTHEIHDLVFLGYYLVDIDNGGACDRFDINLEDMTIDLYDSDCVYRGNIMSIYHVEPQDLYALGKEEEVWDRYGSDEKKEEDDEDEGRKLFNEFIAKYNIDVYEFINLIDKIGELHKKEDK